MNASRSLLWPRSSCWQPESGPARAEDPYLAGQLDELDAVKKAPKTEMVHD
jgi:hypothetical protein